MKKLLLVIVALMLAGCVAVPVYDDGYYYPSYGYYGPYPYPYGFVGPDVTFFVSGFHGGHGFRGGHGFHGGGHGFRGGGHFGGGRR
jgi:hypothetical protein